MTTACARWIALGGLLAAQSLLCPRARGQRAAYSSEQVILGAGGYTLNFGVSWTCDDDPSGTLSAPGQVDLVDSGGNLAGQVLATAGASGPSFTVAGAGAVSNANCRVNLFGAGGTPADAHLHATWNITGPAPGPYTLRLWTATRKLQGDPLSTITTFAQDTGGGGTVGGVAPTPTPTPPPALPPSVVVSGPASATVLMQVALGATAAVSAGGNPLASVAIDVSLDNGGTWARVSTDAHPSSPSDSESAAYAFAAVGTALVRATATDSRGLSGTSALSIAVARAGQAGVTITPSQAMIRAGQGVAFTASGGATGNYAWGGSASGAGASASVGFPSPGAYTVTVVDSGNATYSPSAAASATVNVLAAFYTLSLSASAGGTVSGGGSYAPGVQATAVATASSGSGFTGWSGDLSSAAPALPVVMNSNLSLLASFAALLPQTITVVTPAQVSTLSPPFTLSALATSGLPVTLVLDSGPALLSGSLVSPSGTAGLVTVTATQPGDSRYLPAQPVVVTFPIGRPPAGVVISDDSTATKRSDRMTRTTSYTSNPAH